MFQRESLTIYGVLSLWMYALGAPIIIIGLLVLISTCIVYIFRLMDKNANVERLEEKWNKKVKNISKARRDTYRKISHVLIFIVLFIIWFIGYSLVMASTSHWVGMIPDENNTLRSYLILLTVPNQTAEVLYSLGWFYYLIFFFFYAMCLFLIVNEITRKTKYLSFPLSLFPKLVMTEEEKLSYGTYLYFAIGQMFAAFLCPPMAFFSILGISSIADLMTSQVGIRWGKRHIKWNSDKTWEGTIAGTITSLVLCYFFVGIIWSIIFTLAFLLIDLITSKPLNVSDNLLIPIACSLIYISVRYFFDLNYISPLLQMF
jgi:dolichol kinase